MSKPSESISTESVAIGKVAFGGGAPFALIAGPCVIESREQTLSHAEAIAEACRSVDVPLVYKSSYDKANRSSHENFRGIGIEAGLKILAEVKAQFDLPVLTDVHDVEQTRRAGEVVDCLQIPAFLCRQSDLLEAAAQTGKTVNVKKGQFLAPQDMGNVVEKLRAFGTEKVLLTERGSSFGYHRLVVDYTGFPIMRSTGKPLVFDATHSVQQPGGQGKSSGGDRSKVPYLARAAVACGIDGLFMEVHENPDQAPSDGPNMLPLKDLAGLLRQLRSIEQAARG